MQLAFGANRLTFGVSPLVFGSAFVAPAGSPGGGGTVARKPEPIRPNRRAEVRKTLVRELDLAQRAGEPVPVIEAPRQREKAARTPLQARGVTTDATLGIIREIEVKVQASIDAATLAQAEAVALELAIMAEDEADVEMLLLLAAW